MAYFNFENGVTPLNDTNLNEMQRQIKLKTVENSDVANGNIDEIVQTEYRYTNDTARTPNGENGYLFTQKMDNNYLVQEFTSYDATGKWIRAKTDGVWASWEIIKNFKELEVDSLLANSWVRHSACQIYKENRTVHLNLCIKSGTSQDILALPEGFRTYGTLFFPATTQEKGIYVSLSPSGVLQCAQADIGDLLFISASFLAEA